MLSCCKNDAFAVFPKFTIFAIQYHRHKVTVFNKSAKGGV